MWALDGLGVLCDTGYGWKDTEYGMEGSQHALRDMENGHAFSFDSATFKYDILNSKMMKRRFF